MIIPVNFGVNAESSVTETDYSENVVSVSYTGVNYEESSNSYTDVEPVEVSTTGSMILPMDAKELKIVLNKNEFFEGVSSITKYLCFYEDSASIPSVFRVDVNMDQENTDTISGSYLLKPNTHYTCYISTGLYVQSYGISQTRGYKLFELTTGDQLNIPGYSAEKSVKISSESDLINLRNIPNWNYKYITLEQDIALTEKWEPALNVDFEGIFDGKGYTISGLRSGDKDSTPKYAGLFYSIGSAREGYPHFLSEMCYVKNLKMSDADISGALAAGVLSALVSASYKIENCSVKDSEVHCYLTESGNGGFGGLIGYLYGCASDKETGNCILKNCSVSNIALDVSNYTQVPVQAGGLVGYVAARNLSSVVKNGGNPLTEMEISNCKVEDISINIKQDENLITVIGGMFGSIYSGYGDTIKVTQCSIKNISFNSVINSLSTMNKYWGGIAGLVSYVNSQSGTIECSDMTCENVIFNNTDNNSSKKYYLGGAFGLCSSKSDLKRNVHQINEFNNIVLRNISFPENFNYESSSRGYIVGNNVSNVETTYENTYYLLSDDDDLVDMKKLEANPDTIQYVRLAVAPEDSSKVLSNYPLMENETSRLGLRIAAFPVSIEGEGESAKEVISETADENFPMSLLGDVTWNISDENIQIEQVGESAVLSAGSSSISGKKTISAEVAGMPVKGIDGNDCSIDYLYVDATFNAYLTNVSSKEIAKNGTFTADVVVKSGVPLDAAQIELSVQNGTITSIAPAAEGIEAGNGIISVYNNKADVTNGYKLATVTVAADESGNDVVLGIKDTSIVAKSGEPNFEESFTLGDDAQAVVAIYKSDMVSCTPYAADKYLVKYTGEVADGNVAKYNGADMLYSEEYKAWIAVVDEDVSESIVNNDITVEAGTKASVDYSGDVNLNGKINIVDAQIAYDLAAKVYADFSKADLAMWCRADVNVSGTVEAADARAIQCIIHGITA